MQSGSPGPAQPLFPGSRPRCSGRGFSAVVGHFSCPAPRLPSDAPCAAPVSSHHNGSTASTTPYDAEIPWLSWRRPLRGSKYDSSSLGRRGGGFMCCTGPAALFNPPLPLVNGPLDWGGTVAYHGVTKYGRPFFAGFRDGGGAFPPLGGICPGPSSGPAIPSPARASFQF